MKVEVDVSNYDENKFIDYIVSRVAETFHDRITRAIDETISSTLEERLRALTDKHIEGAIVKVLTDGFQKTDEWGKPAGQPQTIKDIILGYFNSKKDYYTKQTRLEEIVKEQADQALAKELKQETEKAAQAFRKQVDTVLQAKLNEALRNTLGLK